MTTLSIKTTSQKILFSELEVGTVFLDVFGNTILKIHDSPNPGIAPNGVILETNTLCHTEDDEVIKHVYQKMEIS